MEGDANLELFANFRCWQVNGRQSYSTKDLLAFMRLFVFNPQEEQDSFFLRELELNLKTRLENAEYFTVQDLQRTVNEGLFMVDSENINKENMSREVDKIEAILGDSIKDKHSNKLIGAAEELENAKKIIHRIISERSQS